ETLSRRFVRDLDITHIDFERNPSLVDASGQLIFIGHDEAHGHEVWRSDGTAAGTHIVKDIVAGPGSSAPRLLASLGTTTFFSCEESGLWKTDGTDAGTVNLNNTKYVQDGVIFNGKLYYWSVGIVFVSDGTPGAPTVVQNNGAL